MRRSLVALLLALLAAGALSPPEVLARPRRRVSKPAAPAPDPSPSPVAALKEFTDEVERDFALRARGQLLISNLRGGISLQGWAQDKIRVKARRHVAAENPADAKRQLAALDFRHRVVEGDIELSAEYGKGLDIQQRLKERENPRTRMDMVVLAPANLKLRVWAFDGDVSVREWNEDVEIRTSKGPIRIDEIRGDSVSILCPACTISARGVRGSFKCIGGAGDAQISDVVGGQVYVETTTGSQKVQRVRGEQLYISKSGAISGKDLRGRVEFHSQKGSVDLSEIRGFASGNTEAGNIGLGMRDWSFIDKALIESVRGDVVVRMPATFSAEVDLWSISGQAEIGFPLRAMPDQGTVGPEPANHLKGLVGEGGEQFKLFSQQGNVRLLRHP